MRSGSKGLWGAIVGVLAVALVVLLAFALWPDGDDGPSESPTPTPSGSESAPSGGETTPSGGESTPDGSESPGGESLNPDDFGGYPPQHPLEPVFTETPIQLPEQVDGWTLDPASVTEYSLGVEGEYSGDGSLTLTIDTGFLTYKSMVEAMASPEYVGNSVCGEDENQAATCVSATEDADLGVFAPPGTSFEELDAFLTSLIESY